MENIPDSPEGILLESLLEGMNQYYSEECFYGHKKRRLIKQTPLFNYTVKFIRSHLRTLHSARPTLASLPFAIFKYCPLKV